VGNDYCNDFSEGLNHFYRLDNVRQRNAMDEVNTPSSNNGGQINASVIANDGRTIVSATHSGIWLSTTNARSWFLAPGSPTGVGEGITTYKQPDGTIYAGFALGGVSSTRMTMDAIGRGCAILQEISPTVMSGPLRLLPPAHTADLMAFAGNSGASDKTWNWYLVLRSTSGTRTAAGISAGMMSKQDRCRWTSQCSLFIRPRRGRSRFIMVTAVPSRFIATTVCVLERLQLRTAARSQHDDWRSKHARHEYRSGLYIVLKNGDVYRTTAPQEAGRLKKPRCVPWHSGEFLSHRLSRSFSEAAPLF